MGFDSKHKDIELSIIQHLLSAVPDEWDSMSLDVSAERHSNGTHSFSMTLSRMYGAPAMFFPPEELFEAVLQSHALFEEAGKPWAAARYVVQYDDDAEKWRFTIDYELAAHFTFGSRLDSWMLLREELTPVSRLRRAQAEPVWADALRVAAPAGWEVQPRFRMLDPDTPEPMWLAFSQRPRPFGPLPSPPIFGHYLCGPASPFAAFAELERFVMEAHDLYLVYQVGFAETRALREVLNLPPGHRPPDHAVRSQAGVLRLDSADVRRRILGVMATSPGNMQLALIAGPSQACLEGVGPTPGDDRKAGLFTTPSWIAAHAILCECRWILMPNQASNACIYSIIDVRTAFPGAQPGGPPPWRGPPGEPFPPEVTQALPSAVRIDFDGLQVTDLSALLAAPRLVELLVEDVRWLDTDTISELRGLRALSICGAWVEDLAFLEALPALECLAISEPPLQGWEELTRLPHLRWLCLYDKLVLPEGLMAALPEVTVLRASGELGDLVLAHQPRIPRPALLRAVAEGRRLVAPDLRNLDLVGVDLRRAHLVRADLTGAWLAGADFTGARLEECRLDGVDAEGLRLSGAELLRCSFMYAKLQGARLNDADLTGSNFQFCNLGRADLSNARGEGVTMEDAGLEGARLSGAVLSDACLRHADLCGADLRDADLRKAILEETQLDGADARGARLPASVPGVISLDLQAVASDAFAYLESEFGLKMTVCSQDQLRFEGNGVFVSVSFDSRRSYELRVELGQLASPLGGRERWYSLGELLRLDGSPDAADLGSAQITEQVALERFTTRMATALKVHGASMLGGDQGAFSRLEHFLAREELAARHLGELEFAIERAHAAWKRQDHMGVIAALEPFDEKLPPSERKRLEISRSRVR